jgi:predicted Zn-dependent protease
LDKFIENNPKIVPQEASNTKVDIKESTKFDKNELMTETLAKVYLEQKKYKKAIQAFKILSLKYPEKSGFFADQIQAVKKLQKEKD